MEREIRNPPAQQRTSAAWPRFLLIALVFEKVIQRAVVTATLALNWGGIATEVAVDPAVLMVLGGTVGVLFALSLGGLVAGRAWAPDLVLGLALFDLGRSSWPRERSASPSPYRSSWPHFFLS